MQKYIKVFVVAFTIHSQRREQNSRSQKFFEAEYLEIHTRDSFELHANVVINSPLRKGPH